MPIPTLDLRRGQLRYCDVEDWDVFGNGSRISGVYFVQCDVEGPIKIGRARDIGRRFDALQSANPCELYIRLIILAQEAQSLSVERTLHQVFEAQRTRGEWFEPYFPYDPTDPLCWFMDAPLEWSSLVKLLAVQEETRA